MYENEDIILGKLRTSRETLDNIVPQVAANTTAISNIGSATPKGVYTTLADLEAAHPTGTTGIYVVAGSISEIDTLSVTGAPTVSSNVTVTLDGVAKTVAVLLTDTAAGVATKIRAAAYTGWVTGGSGTDVTFTKVLTGAIIPPVFSAGTTGSTATIAVTTAGTNYGNWYYWNGSAWTLGGIFQGTTWQEGVDARTSVVKNKTFPFLKDRLEESEGNLTEIISETNLIKLTTIVLGERVTTSGAILADNYFRTGLIPVVAGDRYASVSSHTVTAPTYAFYNANTIGTSTFVSAISNREAVVPAGATFMLVYYTLTYQANFVVQKLATGFPLYLASTLSYKDLYNKTQAYSKTEVDLLAAPIVNKLNISDLGIELNMLKSSDITIVTESRTDNTGALLSDPSNYRTNMIPVVVGDRYASVSSSVPASPRFTFYNSATPSAGTMVSLSTASKDVIVPEGATHMIFSGLTTLRSSAILMKLATGFPLLGQKTFQYNELYNKTDIDAKMALKLEDKDRPHWFPDTFNLDIIDIRTWDKVLVITEDDVLYGTNSYREIFKATEYDLSDRIVVCELASGATLMKLLFVSATKAVGYVASTDIDVKGFYCFDNADTNAWTARHISSMRAGWAPLEFHSLIKTPNSEYLFSGSYNPTKVTDPEDLTTQAPIDVYRSSDLGESWQIVYTHHNRINQHIHTVEWDIYRDRLWIIVGDDGGGGVAALVYSDDYGATFSYVESDVNCPLMNTVIIPTRRYVLFGTDSNANGIMRWKPQTDEKHAVVSKDDISLIYKIPVPVAGDSTFGFARSPAVDVSSYPYKIAVPFSYTAPYSKACILLSPNFLDWYMLNLVADPNTELSWSGFSGITSDGWVLGWCTFIDEGYNHYIRFKFPKWIEN